MAAAAEGPWNGILEVWCVSVCVAWMGATVVRVCLCGVSSRGSTSRHVLGCRLDATWGRRRTCKSDVRESRRPARLRTFCPFSGVYGHFLFFLILVFEGKKLKYRLQKMTMRKYFASVDRIVAPTDTNFFAEPHTVPLCLAVPLIAASTLRGTLYSYPVLLTR